MKKINLLSLLLLGTMMIGCGNNTSESSSSMQNEFEQNNSEIISNNQSSELNEEVELTNVEVICEKMDVNYLGDFDETTVSVKATYSDNSEKIYTHEDIKFNYSKFANTVFGKQSIEITVEELNISRLIEVNVVPSNSFSMLMIGNDFTDDTIQWVNELCVDLNIDANIGLLCIGSSTLDMHYENLLNNVASYNFKTYDKTNKVWNVQSNISIANALSSYDWDFISLEQESALSGVTTSYSNLNDIISKINEIDNEVEFVWNMTWAYQQDSAHPGFVTYDNNQLNMYEEIVKTVKTEVASKEKIVTTIPVGTAIQNARTSYISDYLTLDGYHLSSTLGKYIAGLSLIKTMTAADISNVTYTPLGLDKSYVSVAIEAVNNAYNKPLEITNSNLVGKIITIDLAASGFLTGGESIGVYFYNKETNESKWEQVLLSGNIGVVKVPNGMDAFKVLRTEITNQEISWENPYWGASAEILLTDEASHYKFTSFNGGNFIGNWDYPLPNNIEVIFKASGLITGGERFGIYFYNAETGANTWVQATLKAYSAYLNVPSGMTAFKILRTSLSDNPITWESAWWGGSEEILLSHESNRYLCSDFNASGAITGEWINEQNPTLTIEFEAAGLITGGERFGVYFYDKATNVNLWVQVTLTGSVGTVQIPYGMTAFKVRRTSLGEEEISWNSPYWGDSEEIIISSTSSTFIFNSFDNGVLRGQWSE